MIITCKHNVYISPEELAEYERNRHITMKIQVYSPDIYTRGDVVQLLELDGHSLTGRTELCTVPAVHEIKPSAGKGLPAEIEITLKPLDDGRSGIRSA